MKNRNNITMKSILMTVIMIVSVALPITVFANAQEDYNKAQQELDRIEKELASIKNNIKKQKEEKKNAQTQIGLVKNQLSSLNQDISATSEKLKQKQVELEEKKADIYETDELFKSKLKAMYIRRNGSVMATALAVNTFSEMLTSVNTLQNISKADNALLQKLDEEKKAIEKVEAEIKQELNDLESKKAKQEAKQKELANLLKKVNGELSDSEAQEEAAKSAYADAKAARDAAAAELEKEFQENGGMGDFVGGEFIWPLPNNRRVSSPYGYRTIFGYREFHTGIDIPAPGGTPILASNSGIVTTAKYASTGYGNRVILDHGGNQKTLYAHCSSLAVKEGDYVAQGQVIGYVGTTGMSTGNHLHFEIRQNNSTVDPYPYIKNH